MTVRRFLNVAFFLGLSTLAAAQSAPTPAMTTELMARLIKFAKTSEIDDKIARETCAIFNLGDCAAAIPARRVMVTTPGGKHLVSVPRDESLGDVIITFKTDTGSLSYLTDKTGALRAAAAWNGATYRLVPNEEAAKRYAIEMEFLAKQAMALPAAQ